MNYYELLDIAKDADGETIKRAYFAAVRKHSPDADPEGFKAVRVAYDTLRDPKKREGYDAYFVVSGEAGENVQNDIFAARELMRQNKYTQAVETLARAGLNNPESRELQRLLAEALWVIKKTRTADSICKGILEEDPSDWETMLLRAKISGSRGHWMKADEYFDAAIALNPASPRVWTDYIRYADKNKEWMVPDICKMAMNADPDIFRDDYICYLYPVLEETKPVFTMFSGSNTLSDNLKLCFAKFTEFFIADKDPSEDVYKTALNALNFVGEKKGFLEAVENILPALENCARRSKADDRAFSRIYGAIAAAKLREDARIKDVLIDYTVFTIEDCGCSECKETKLQAECYIVMNLTDLRASIRALRNNFPDYYKLNQAFYIEALNEKKTEYITSKYFNIIKRMAKTAPKGEYYDDDDDFDDDDFDDDDIDDFDIFGGGYDSYETQIPFVRETPKVGRNEPCPCGSGKKYKKCCGQ